jgi:hypothetical protein
MRYRDGLVSIEFWLAHAHGRMIYVTPETAHQYRAAIWADLKRQVFLGFLCDATGPGLSPGTLRSIIGHVLDRTLTRAGLPWHGGIWCARMHDGLIHRVFLDWREGRARLELRPCGPTFPRCEQAMLDLVRQDGLLGDASVEASILASLRT